MSVFEADDFLAGTLAIIALLAGVHLNGRVAFLRDYNIPEPVTGGLLAAALVFAVYALGEVTVSFDLQARDRYLVYFFTAIGINARVSDLSRGGRPLLILLALTVGFIAVQNAVGIAAAAMAGLDPAAGVLAGSASLIGGHGTAIAWAPRIKEMGIDNAMEIGVASATLGLVLASLIGGPIAKFLILRHRLQGASGGERIVGVGYRETDTGAINHLDILRALLVIHLAIILGYLAHQGLAAAGVDLPLFVPCLLSGILLSNTVPAVFPKIHWPARTKALAVVSDFSLALFLTMSLMSMQLWKIADLAGSLLLILGLQTLAAFVFIIFVLFKLMGKNYQAAVLSAGFGGFALGATPVAIANMTAVTKAHGPAPTAFIILPLVAAFFVDVANAFIIPAALRWGGGF
jgi:ESS family glutamate:Na+ symporter